MTDEELLLKKRFIELAKKSDERSYFTFTDFLGLAERSIFAEAKTSLCKVSFTEYGGAEGCERVMIRFGNEEELGYSEPFPITVLKIEPRAAKFADKLTHRDFLGSILSLGIERSTLGDIVIRDNVGYLFAKDDMASYIADSLTKIKHTDVKVTLGASLPEGELYKTERIKIQLLGERIDAAVAKVFNLSRDDSLSYFKKRLVFVGGKLCENNSYTPKQNEVISVRGLGRFIYLGASGTTKKGRTIIEIDKFV